MSGLVGNAGGNLQRTGRYARCVLIVSLACILLGAVSPSAAVAETVQIGSAGSEAAPTALFADVIDTYKSFSTANYPEHNVQQHDVTYRQLRFPKGYRLSRVDVKWTTAGLGPNGFPGFISLNRCVYATW